MASKSKQNILVLNGPNLNMLGQREPEIYGTTTLEDIRKSVEKYARGLNFKIDFRQSNHEGELVDWVHKAKDDMDGIVINAGAYTHTSVALLDAIRAIDTPVIEVHLSNIYGREAYRRNSYISQGAKGVICGFGPLGYLLALDAMKQEIESRRSSEKSRMTAQD